jgi:VIT1/CCC1 family predicted Fe2+/Mn2+ transporter
VSNNAPRSTGAPGGAAGLKDGERYRQNLRGEIDSAALYRTLASTESSPQLAEVYKRLAAVEERHAEVWRKHLQELGEPVPPARPSARARLLSWLVKRFGSEALLPVILAGEASDIHSYDDQPEARAAGLPAQERSHGRVFRTIEATSRQGLTGQAVARLEGRHRATGGNALRAAVLGVNDGLVSNLSLTMGVAGAALTGTTILLTGLAGLLAGAISMALGEWLSVTSSRELYARQLAIEREELEEVPDEEQEELALIYEAKGIPPAKARELAASIVAQPDSALDTLAREELGIDPEGLGGSAWTAAGTSFVLFATGAFIPIIPYIFTSGLLAVVLSGVFAAVGLFASGVLGSFFTGQPMLKTGLRHVSVGLIAALVTYALGKLVGAGLGA